MDKIRVTIMADEDIVEELATYPKSRLIFVDEVNTIKVKIENLIQQYKNLDDEEDIEDYIRDLYSGIAQYDEDKFKDGKVVYFNSLKEVEAFRKEADKTIRYTEEKEKAFSQWSWQVIDIELTIDETEVNTMNLYISAHDEWRD